MVRRRQFIFWGIFSILWISLIDIQAAGWSSYGGPYDPNNRSSPYQIPPGGYRFRSQTPNNQMAQPPTQLNHYVYPDAHVPIPPKFEVEISNQKPYVQENIILTLRVISDGNINQMDPVLPQTQAIAFQLLHNPISSTQFIDGESRIVNEMRYMVTFINPGLVDIKPSVTVSTGNDPQQQQRTTLKLPHTLHIDVQPQVAGVIPWLPLENLKLESNLDTSPTVTAGEPVTLILKLSAAGALGNQLPSLEEFLQAPDFRVYRGKTKWEGGPSQDGRHIKGVRTEHYTLVPQYGGKLRLPELRIIWFNVETDTIEYTTLPVRMLTASGSEMGQSDRHLTGKPHESGIFAKLASGLWLPAAGLLLLFIGYWLGVWYHHIWSPPPIGTLLHIPRASFNHDTGWFITNYLKPHVYWSRALNYMASRLPLSIRFWLWVRSANVEPTPTIWRRTLQFLSWRALRISTQATAQLPADMAERIIKLQPAAKPQQIRQLLKQLDGAAYGNQQLDFDLWKQDFERQIRPKFSFIFKRRNNGKNFSQRYLPPLNPKL